MSVRKRGISGVTTKLHSAPQGNRLEMERIDISTTASGKADVKADQDFTEPMIVQNSKLGSLRNYEWQAAMANTESFLRSRVFLGSV
jgi:hypothetical protein